MPSPSRGVGLGAWEWPDTRNLSPVDRYFEGTILDAVEYRGEIVIAGNLWVSSHNVQARNLVTFDGSLFHPIFTEMEWNYSVHCLYVLDGNLYFGGRFRTLDGMPASNLGVWYQGDEVLLVGDGLPAPVQALGEFQGRLVAATSFASRTSDPTLLYIYDGGDWIEVELPPGIEMGAARAFLDRGSELWVGGMFLEAGQVPARGRSVAVWNGVEWSFPGDGLVSDGRSEDEEMIQAIVGTTSLAEFGGQVYAAGSFHHLERSRNGFARWNGEDWESMPFDGIVNDLVVTAEGIVPLGIVEIEATPGLKVRSPMAWDGSQWKHLGNAAPQPILQVPHRGLVRDGRLVLFGDPLEDTYFVGGDFSAYRWIEWDGRQWLHPFGPENMAPRVYDIQSFGDEVMVAGDFWFAREFLSPWVVGWNGSQYVPMAAGFEDSDCYRASTKVYDITSFEGRPIAIGVFGLQGLGDQSVAAWDGARWQPMATGLQDSSEYAFGGAITAVEFEGQLVVAGPFTHAGAEPINGIAAWDGSSWSAFAAGPDSVYGTEWRQYISELHVHEGSLYAYGQFSHLGGVETGNFARWNGAQWEPALGTPGTDLNPVAEWNGALYVERILSEDESQLVAIRAGQMEPIATQSPPFQFRDAASTPESLLLTSNDGIWTWDGNGLEPLSEVGASRIALHGGTLYAGSTWVELPFDGQWIPWGGRISNATFAWAPFDESVPVVTVDLRARLESGRVALSWSASAAEVVDAYQVQRRCDTCVWETVGSFDDTATDFTDAVPHDGLWTYRLVALVDGTRIESQPVTLDTRASGAPTRSFVNSIRPNPFNGATTIEYTTARRGNVTIKVYALDGRQVNESNQGTQDIGPHTWTWNGQDAQGATVASGVYVLRVEAPDRVLTQRVAYVK